VGTKTKIREAALRLFASKGYEATGIRDIAREAGVSVATLYGHMSNKQDLLVTIMEYGLVRLSEAARELVSASDDPVEQLAALVRLHVWVHARRRQSAIVVDTELRSLTGDQLMHTRSLRDDYEKLWRDVVRRGNLEGCMDVPEPKLTSFAILEMCTGVSHWYRPDGELNLSYVCDVFVDSALGITRAIRQGLPVRAKDVRALDPEEVYRRVEVKVKPEVMLRAV
jgi:AcrR family transcriptional regulator